MKLDELHIGDGCPGAERHCDTVAGGDVRVRRVEINFAATAGRQRDPRCREGVDLSGFIVQYINTGAAVGLFMAKLGRCDKVDRKVVLQYGNVFMRADGHE